MKKQILLLTIILSFSLHPSERGVSGKTSYADLMSCMRHRTVQTPYQQPVNKERRTGIFSTALHTQGFYQRSTNKNTLGRYFGWHNGRTGEDESTITIAADENSTLFPQDIIHNSAFPLLTDVANNPLNQTISFAPWMEEYGVIVSTETSIYDSCTVTASLPTLWKTHHLGMTTSRGTKQVTSDGDTVSALDYFQGFVAQKNLIHTNQQTALTHGKFKEVQTHQGIGDMKIHVDCIAHHDEHVRINAGLHMIIPTTNSGQGEYLFEPLLGSAGHCYIGGDIGIHIRGTTFAGSALSCSLSLMHERGTQREHIRMIDFDTGLGEQAYFYRYALSGKVNGRRLVPFANILTQPVNVTPSAHTQLGATLHWHNTWLHGAMSYHFLHAAAESVERIQKWPLGTFALTQNNYSTLGDPDLANAGADAYEAFTISDHAFNVLNPGDARHAVEERHLMPEAAATPRQQNHSIDFSLKALPFSQHSHLLFMLQGAYHFTGSNTAIGLSGWTLTGGMTYLF